MQTRFLFSCLILSIFFLLISQLVFSQSSFNVDIQTYTMEDGLPNNHVYQCFQDHRGLMWVLVSNTLNQFDGKKFHKVLDKELNLHYTSNKICFEDKDGDIWLRTENPSKNNSFVLINSSSGKIHSPTAKYGSSFPKNVSDARPGNQKTVWLTTTKGELLRYTPGKKSSPIYHAKHNEICTIIQVDTIRHLIWLATARPSPTYYLIDFGGHEIVKHTVTNSQGEFTDEQGALHYYTWEKFGAIDVKGKIWEKGFTSYIDHYDPSKEKYKDLPLARDIHSGDYWIKNQNGLSVFNLKTGKKYTLKDWGNKERPMHVYSLFMDRQGIIWLAAVGGLFKLTIKPVRFQRLLWQDLSKKTHQASFPTRSIVKDEAKGVLYINGGHHLWAINRGKATKVMSTDMDYYSSNIDQQGQIWVGDSYLRRCNPANQTILTVPILPNTIIWSILPRKDRIWLGSSSGLLYYDLQDKQIHFVKHDKDAPELYHTVIHSIRADQQGKLWLLTEQGLFHYDPQKGMIARYWTGGKGKYHLPVDNLRHVYIETNGTWWIATIDGLLQWSPNTGRWKMYNKKQGFPDQNIYAVYPDDFGFLWMSCDRGIIQFQKRSGRNRYFLLRDGISDEEFNRISHYQDKDGIIYFGSLNGVTAFHPRDFYQDFAKSQNIPLLLAAAQMFSKRHKQVENLEDDYQQHQQFTFNHGDLYLTLRFALLDYHNAATRRFEYRIEGLENTWAACQGDMLQLAGLPYGHFTLCVRAKLENGLFSSQQLAIPIVVRPPFYLRWGFLVLVLTFLLTGITLFFQYRHQNSTTQLAMPEQQTAILPAENQEHYFQLPTTLTPEEKAWLELLEKNVVEHLHNPDFTVSDLAKSVLLSRTLLYNEMGRILGLTPNLFINEIRMFKALEILKDSPQELTVKKLASQVGFRDEKYFSQKFKQRFGMLPSQVKEGLK